MYKNGLVTLKIIKRVYKPSQKAIKY